MKKIIILLFTVLLVFGLVACGNAAGTDTTKDATAAEASDEQTIMSDESQPDMQELETTEEDIAVETTDSSSGKNVLVVYFSATGNTKGVAEKIAAITDADIYEIKAMQEYTSDDLNYNDSNSRTTLEQNDPSVRPEIGSDIVSLEGYDTIYIGYPIWWGEEPRIMDTFVENYNFDGITMIPFCTSSSSGIGRSGQNLADNAGSGSWLDGQRFSGSVSEAELQSWIDGLQ